MIESKSLISSFIRSILFRVFLILILEDIANKIIDNTILDIDKV